MTNSLEHVFTDEVLVSEGIYSPFLKEGQERTVWDTLARENPTHAVVSSPNEKQAKKKTEEQIRILEKGLIDGIVLDLGCGYGRVAQYLLPRRVFEGFIGVDSSIEMLALFKKRYDTEAEERKTPLALVQANIDALPLKDNSVDNVIVSAVFLHNHKSVTKKSIAEIHRILKKGGKLFILSSFPNGTTLSGVQGHLYNLFLKLRKQEYKNGPVRFFSRKEVRELLGDFEKVVIQDVGFSFGPKSLIFLPQAADTLYRKIIFQPLNVLGARFLPAGVKKIFPTHYDAVAVK
jgi:ubiquinone/menaquinone biosynthesis C-methylase UbiE